jgi:ABC-2 type transport system permease protein
VVFPLLYLTTSQAPKNLLPKLFGEIASYNPVTYIIEGVRALVLYGWGTPAVWQGFVVVGAMFVILVSFTLYSFQKTLK